MGKRDQEDLLDEVRGLRKELEDLRTLARRTLLSQVVKQFEDMRGAVDVRGPVPCPDDGKCNLCGRGISKGDVCYLVVVGSANERRAYAFHEGCVDGMVDGTADKVDIH